MKQNRRYETIWHLPNLPELLTLLDPLLVEKRLLLLALLSLDEAALDVLLPVYSLDPPVMVLLRETRVFLSFSLPRVCLSMFTQTELVFRLFARFYLLHMSYISHCNKLFWTVALITACNAEAVTAVHVSLILAICNYHLHHSEIK